VVLDAGAYAIHLPAFDGPLDLLLHLIRREEMDIFDIQISQLTRGYVETLEDMRKQGIEPASEFLLMIATLMQIKSRMLLPRPVSCDDIEEGSEDPRAELVRQLLEYERFKEASQSLDGLVRRGRDVFFRPTGQDRPAPEDPELQSLDAYRLAQAFRLLMGRQRFQAPHQIHVERVSIAERIAQIADRLVIEKRVSFATLCLESESREEVITTFLALLEMARLRLIRVTQRSHAAPLYLESRVEDIDVRGEEAAGTLVDE
jgi:segregation and condensation protein A